MIANIHHHSDNRPRPEPAAGGRPMKTRALVHVTLGRLDRHCEGLGICKVTLAEESPKLSQACCSGLAVISIGHSDEWEISFIKRGLTEQQRNKYFIENQFIVERSFYLPPGLCEKLGHEELCIPAGWYPVENELSFYTIKLKL
jgi:hypothetical protein